jgi:CRP/FNR family transcriptional regulator, anaerobic regulatory protein
MSSNEAMHRGRPGGLPDLAGPPRLATNSCRVVQAGEHLFHYGDPVHDAYLIRSGNFTSYIPREDGDEQFIGLHGPGDLVGVDAIIGLGALYSVRATDVARVQALHASPERLVSSAGNGSSRMILEGLYLELQRLTDLLFIDRHPSDRRLAEFLLDFSARHAHRGQNPDRLILPITCRELARHLGLAPETLSRSFANLQSNGLARLKNREVIILDRNGLSALAAG